MTGSTLIGPVKTMSTLMPTLLPTLPPLVLPDLPGLENLETTSTSMANTTTTAVEHLTVVTCSDLGIDSDRMKQSEAGGFLVSIAINFLSLLGALLIIYLISRSKRGHRVLVPKKQGQGGGAIGLPHEWFRDAYRIEFDDMDQISIDGQVVIRLCLLGLKFSAFGSLIACVLVPVYAYASESQQGVLKFSMTNVTPDSDDYVFWCIVVGAYLLVFNFFWLVRAEWRHFITLRQKHFLRRALGKDGIASAQAQFSLMVERLPTKYQDSRNILSLFSQIFPRQVHSAVAQRDTLLFYHLRALKKTSDTIVVCTCCQGCVHRQLERTVQFERKVAQKYRQTEKYVQDFAMDGQVVELRDDLVSQLGIHQVNHLFTFAHGSGENGQNGSAAGPSSSSAFQRPELRRSSRLDAESQCAPTSTAFVTLRKLSDRVIAEQIPLFDAGGDSDGVEKVVVKPAPEADAIIWENVQLPLDHILQRRFIGRAICIVGILFWSIPISSIQALASKNVLNELLPPGWLEWIAEHTPVVYSLLMLYLPVIALMAVLVLLPMALQLIAVFVEARKSHFEVAISVMHRNFWFQFFSLWLMVFTSSLAQSFLQIMDHPRCISAILGASIPKVSVYFTSFVITRIGISLPLLLLRPESLYSLFFWKSKAAGKTDDSDSDSSSEEETAAAVDATLEAEPNPVYCYFASEVTNINIVFVLALMYCVVAPIMMPACLLYFALAFFVYKWLFVHVYTKEYDLMGETWYACFWGLIVGALFGSIALAGLAAIQTGSKSPQCIALWVLSFAILVFAFHCQKTFMPFCAALPYRAAVLADETTSSAVVEGFTSDYYHDPILNELTEKETQEILTSIAEDTSDEAESCLPASP